jgi:hypothetical protein
MKFRALALGATMAVAVTAFIPATAMAATGATPPAASMGTANANSNANANANADSKNNINVSVVTQLPKGDYWSDKKIYDHGREVALPSGYKYTDGGVMGPDDHFYFAPSGARDGVVVAPLQCQNGKYGYNSASTGNWIGSIVDSALKACAGVYDAAYNVIATAFGNSGGRGGYGSGC